MNKVLFVKFTKGRLQMGGVSTGALSVIVPDIELLELPYAFKNAETADRVLEGSSTETNF